MNTQLLMRQLALTRLECGDELEALRRVAQLSRETIADLRQRGITSWYQLLHSSHAQLLNSKMWPSSIMHLDAVLERVGWSFGMSDEEICRQLCLTTLPAEIILNSPSPSR